MLCSTIVRRTAPGLVALAVVAGAYSARVQAQAPAQDPADPTPVAIGSNYEAGNACYHRLPDLPDRRYGGFGGYNADTGVLAYAGGALKLSADNTEAQHDLYAIKLDGSMTSWNTIPYNASVGFTRERDKGCREGTSVMLSTDRWLSVFGKDGCDNGAFDTGSKKGGDLKELAIGDTANGTGVRWVANSGAQALPATLKDEKGKLIRAFAAFDTKRNRLVFGQGTFDDEKNVESQDKVYAATASGSKWQVRELTPSGPKPVARFGTCATYVSDTDTGLDGLLVLGGQQGGLSGTTTYKEVWWLDFAASTSGVWSEITSRFGNMDEIGFRREGACAYNPDSKTFYSWMGRANSKIPGGASHSAGIWMTDLSRLGDPTAALTWVKVAQDNQGQALRGRRLIPSVYDFANNRFFAMGGRNGDDALADVWAIYPGVTGAACANLDPYAPFANPVTPTTPPPGPTTPPPGPTTPPPGPTTPTPTTRPQDDDVVVCEGLDGKVPAAAVAEGAGNPTGVSGWMDLCHPNLPASPYNTLRRFLDIRNPGAPYHPIYNSLVFRCGCR